MRHLHQRISSYRYTSAMRKIAHVSHGSIHQQLITYSVSQIMVYRHCTQFWYGWCGSVV